MAEIRVGGSLPEDLRCKRSDGKGWQCSLPLMEGKVFCQAHYLQSRQRQLRKRVPDTLKLDRARRNILVPKVEQESTTYDLRSNDLPRRQGKRKIGDVSEVVSSSVPRKRSTKGDSVAISEPVIDPLQGYIKPEKELVVKDLKYGLMEILQASPSPQAKSAKRAGSSKSKIGVPVSESVSRRPIRSKNVEPCPIATVKMLPSIKANVKAGAKKKNNKKRCRWCKWSSYGVFAKCWTCKKQFFCQDCIDERIHQLHMIRLLLPVMEKMNQEKIIVLDTEAKNKGRTLGQLQVQLAGCSQKKQCRLNYCSIEKLR